MDKNKKMIHVLKESIDAVRDKEVMIVVGEEEIITMVEEEEIITVVGEEEILKIMKTIIPSKIKMNYLKILGD